MIIVMNRSLLTAIAAFIYAAGNLRVVRHVMAGHANKHWQTEPVLFYGYPNRCYQLQLTGYQLQLNLKLQLLLQRGGDTGQ